MLENYAGDPNYPDQWRYRFGYLENGQFKSLMDGITFKQETRMELLHLFGDSSLLVKGTLGTNQGIGSCKNGAF